MNTYTANVTRIETFTVSDRDLERERMFQKGKQDRINKLPCSSPNGAYLNGWYSPQTEFYYIPKEAAHLL